MVGFIAFVSMMTVQFISYLNLTFNYRAIATEQYLFIFITDGLASLISFFIIQKVAKSKHPAAVWGMALGGALAGVVGTWLSRHWG